MTTRRAAPLPATWPEAANVEQSILGLFVCEDAQLLDALRPVAGRLAAADEAAFRAAEWGVDVEASPLSADRRAVLSALLNRLGGGEHANPS